MTKIEQVARAIFDKAAFQNDWLKLPSELEFERDKNYWINQARAAIEAMKEPTRIMLNEGQAIDDCGLEAQYNRMIDAALKE